MAPYSMDLRTRVLRDSEAGMPSKEVAAKYSVSRAWVDRVKQRWRETGETAPRRQSKFRGRTLDEHQEYRLVALIAAQPDATLAELRDALPTTAALSTLWRTIDRLGLTVKKLRSGQRHARLVRQKLQGVRSDARGCGRPLSGDIRTR